MQDYLITYYTYDLLNNVTQVSMPRSTGTQTRTFNYNNTAFLQNATNPENGTVIYTYNQDGTLATKTDAKGQKIAYTYDGYKRLGMVQRYPPPGTVEDICQRVTYYYDTDPFAGVFSQYAWGRRTGVEYGNATANCGSAFPTKFAERYSYTQGGLVTKKRLTVTANLDTEGGTNLKSRDLDTEQTYDNEGKALTVKYPDALGINSVSDYIPVPGATYTYTYDAMGRPIALADNRQTPVNWVTNVQYGASNELKQIDYRIAAGLNNNDLKLEYQSYQSETRTYNIRGQLTRITGGLDVEYRYSPTQNNGQITQQKDWVTGEEVSYQYDSLQRLISAVTTPEWAPEWGQSFTYDGFGNRTGATVTKGSAPSSSMVYDPATNRIVGSSYDANGNMLNVQGATLAYDVDNRVVSATVSGATEYYAYTPGNQRIWKLKANGTVELYFYGISGQKLGTYNVTRTLYQNMLSILVWDVNVYFGARKIVSSSGPAVRDRLGSSRTGGSKYFPYGEEQVVTAQDRDKFGTYYRDGTTGLDYAQNRYYANTLGRFTSPDPYVASGGAADPQSWNRYAYVGNDPLNFNDPEGLTRCWVEHWSSGAEGTLAHVNCFSNDGLSLGEASYSVSKMADEKEESRVLADAAAKFKDFDPNDWDLVPAAVSRAIQALTLNKDCLELFGNAITRQGRWDPATVITNMFLLRNNEYGRVDFEFSGVGTAETRPAGGIFPRCSTAT